jgi:diguanylate cyclase (GGDEF)-like protein
MESDKVKVEPTILVIDDNPVIIKLLTGILTRSAFRVTAVTNGDEALASLGTQKVDLVLLDVDMLGQSGFAVCQNIKANPQTKNIPVIFVTSHAGQEDVLKGFAAGGQDYIVKPFTHAELLARVRTHLTLRKVQEDLQESVIRYRNLSIIDDLTGFYNTRFLYQSLNDQLENHPDTALSVVFIDIDSFKKVVDAYGHLNGSSTIAELAEIIMPMLPDGCYGVSYGGDEFVLILAGHDRAAGGLLIERIRQAIEQASFLAFCGLNVHITVSSGIASYPEDAKSLEELLSYADHALFEAKRLGKNKIVSFSEMRKETPG